MCFVCLQEVTFPMRTVSPRTMHDTEVISSKIFRDWNIFIPLSGLVRFGTSVLKCIFNLPTKTDNFKLWEFNTIMNNAKAR
jgi:hypothetical protein